MRVPFRYVFHFRSSGDAEDRFGLPVTAARSGPNWSQGVRRGSVHQEKTNHRARRAVAKTTETV